MKFIFPQNYNFNFKLLGFLDYKKIIFNLIFFIFIYLVTKCMGNLNLKIIIFIVFYFLILLFSIFGFNQENIIYVIKYIFLYLKNPKLYLFTK